MPQRDYMMRHSHTKTLKPYATWGLMYLMIFAYGLVFTLQMTLPFGDNTVFETWGMVPARLVHDQYYLPVITAIFLHSNALHLAVNLLFCYAFSPFVERRIGPIWFVAFFITCGIGGNIAQGLWDQTSAIPVVGASGAISGLIAYVAVTTWGKTGKYDQTPLVWLQKLLIIFFILDAVSNIVSLLRYGIADEITAFGAHVGGFLTGLLITLARSTRL